MNISAHFEPSRHIVGSGWSSPLEAKASQGRKAAQRARDRSIMEEEKEGVGGAEVSERDATDSSPKFPGMWRSSISHLFYTAPILKRFCFPLTSLFHSLHPSIHPGCKTSHLHRICPDQQKCVPGTRATFNALCGGATSCWRKQSI